MEWGYGFSEVMMTLLSCRWMFYILRTGQLICSSLLSHPQEDTQAVRDTHRKPTKFSS